MKNDKERNYVELSKNHVLEVPLSHAKMRLKSAPQKLNFLMVKGIQKVIHQLVATNALARFRIVTHCYIA